MTPLSTSSKFKTVLEKNTYYFQNSSFENDFDLHIKTLIKKVVQLQTDIDKNGLSKKTFEDFLKKQDALKVILAITSISFETLIRLVTIIRITNDDGLNDLFLADKWVDDKYEKEWNSKKIETLVKNNEYFRKGIVNFLFDGYNAESIKKILPKFELEKIKPSKLDIISSLSLETIDTLIRYKEKGSYVSRKENNPESLMKKILKFHNIPYETGDLPLLVKYNSTRKRTMDFIIPNKDNPKLIMEFSYVKTTSSGQGDKAKTENGVKDLIEKYYPNAKFIGFIDGIGWIGRPKDAERLCESFDDVFTFHEDELNRFTILLKTIFPEKF